MTGPRDYYNRRVGHGVTRPHLTLQELADQIEAIYSTLNQQGYLQRAFGYRCVDAGKVSGVHGSDLRTELYLQTGVKLDGGVGGAISTADEVILFTLIEFVHDHVAKPHDGDCRYHAWDNCGLHVDPLSPRFDEAAARREWRDKVNRPLKFYGDGFQLSEAGEVVRLAPDGMATHGHIGRVEASSTGRNGQS